MQTAAQPRKTAREAIFDGRETGEIRQDVDLNAIRYFVQLGWDMLTVDSYGIPNAYLLRGEISPCRTYRCKANLLEIREGELIPGSEERDRDNKLVWGSYNRYAHHEAERLVLLEARAERKTGLFEVTALNGPLGNEVYRKVNLNELFFPGWPEMPEKNEDVIAGLRKRLAQLKSSTPANMPAHYLPVIYAVGDQLIEAAERAEFVQKARLTFTHSCLKLTPKDEAYKRNYDDVDYEMLKRTGIPEVHAAEVQTAQALEKLSERSDDGELKELVGVLKAKIDQDGEIIRMLLAERQREPRGNIRKRKHRVNPATAETA